MPIAERQEHDQDDVVTKAIAEAKFKDARLRLMKQRNEQYLADQRDEREADDEQTREL
jgi:hypothetical protein